MKLITRFDAVKCTTAGLHVLHREALDALAAAPSGSQDARNAMSSLITIERELAWRGPGF
ncbi:hypothetical protein [Rhodophyticola porphyridii]|uniref:hypothetical protein n=1 Tax=Rhodophyticola porphyridii TaxID=1852017 RepID=UPI0035D010A3